MKTIFYKNILFDDGVGVLDDTIGDAPIIIQTSPEVDAKEGRVDFIEEVPLDSDREAPLKKRVFTEKDREGDDKLVKDGVRVTKNPTVDFAAIALRKILKQANPLNKVSMLPLQLTIDLTLEHAKRNEENIIAILDYQEEMIRDGHEDHLRSQIMRPMGLDNTLDNNVYRLIGEGYIHRDSNGKVVYERPNPEQLLLLYLVEA